MKPLLPILLALSLAANAALYFKRPAASTPTPQAPRSLEEAAALAARTAGKPDPATVARTPEQQHRELWEKLRSGDPAIVERLRAAGWPESAIHALVVAQINELYAARRKALFPENAKAEYWKQNPGAASWTPERQKIMRDLLREQHALLKKLLGPDYAPERSRYELARFANLTPTQAQAVSAIEADYQILNAEIRGGYGSNQRILLPEDRDKLAYLEKEQQADLAKVLSPEELLDYELRTSNAASMVRWGLSAFNPTEQEFRQIFAIQKAAALPTNYGQMSTTQQQAYSKAQAEIDAQVKKILSPERAADYTRAKDNDYQRLYALAERLKLAPENAIAAYDVKADIEKRSRELKPAAGPDGRKAYEEARAALVKEAEQRLVESLGQRGFDAYKANGAYWLMNLQPRPAPPARPAATAAPAAK